MAKILLVLAVSVGVVTPSYAEILFRHNEASLFDGRYGPIAKAQSRANEALVACGRPATIKADGKFGLGMRKALASLALCPNFAEKLAGDADARAGALTHAFWDALVSEAVPSVDDRARTLMLTYEATDYTALEWNFCQSRPLYDPTRGQNICYSNDPRSYLTWGPNGATAGGGREIQLILQAVDREAPSLLNESFGSEADAVRRMSHFPDRDTPRSLETFLCGVWADQTRRATWRSGFETLGRAPVVRNLFDGLYRSSSLDGGKIATFYRAYSTNGLTPTEVDYAFFKDRAAHTSPAFSPINQAIEDVLNGQPDVAHWKVRRAIALRVRPGSQRDDRLGRDVAFYIDGAAGVLKPEERSAWSRRGRLRASDVGLSDSRDYPEFTPAPAIDTRISHPQSPTEAERMACPSAVLDTRRP